MQNMNRYMCLVFAVMLLLFLSCGDSSMPHRNAETAYKMGNAAFEKGNLREAVRLYIHAIKSNPKHVDARNNLGIIYMSAGQLDDATNQFDAVLRIRKDHPKALSNLGLCYLKKGDVKNAINCFLNAIKVKPDCLPPYLHLAKCYMLGGNHKGASKCLDLAESIAPDDRSVLLTRAGYAGDLGQVAAAKNYFNRLISTYPNDQEGLVKAGLFFLSADQHTKSLPLFRKAIKLNPRYGFAHYGMAMQFYSDGSSKAALGGFRKALSLGLSADAEAMANMYCGLLYKGTGELSTAERHLKAAYRKEPQSRLFLFSLASLYHSQNRSSEAMNLYKKTVSLYPKDKESLNNIGLILLERKEYSQALNYFKQVLAVDGRYGPAICNKGLALLSLGRFKEAADTLSPLAKQADTGDPNAVEAFRILVKASKKIGR